MLTKKYFNMLVSSLLISMVFVTNVQAQIYKCTGEKGAVYYNDKPCPSGDKEKKIKNAKDVVNGYVPPVSKSQPIAGLKEVKKIPQHKKSDKEAQDSQQKKLSDLSKENSVRKTLNNKVENKQQSKSTPTKQPSFSKTNTRTEIKDNNTVNNFRDLSPAEEEILFIDMHAGEVFDGQ